MEFVLRGIPASAGIAMANAFVMRVESPLTPHVPISAQQIPEEIERFRSARSSALVHLQPALMPHASENTSSRRIIESYAMIVMDASLQRSIEATIQEGNPAEYAVVRELDAVKLTMQRATTEFLKDRAQDFEHVKELLVSTLRNRSLLVKESAHAIVVAGSVTPQELVTFGETGNLGFVTEIGGINAHTSIMARDMNIPAVIGVSNATAEIPDSAELIIDGYAGVVVVHPTEETKEFYRNKQRQETSYRVQLGEMAFKEAVTISGTHITLLANVDSPQQAERAMMMGADGIGLVRTEAFLSERGGYPTEHEETQWYRSIAQCVFPKPVTFRAFDVGADKFRDGIPIHEDNPALGLRGIRFLLYRTDIFRQQIRAVLRASEHRNVRFMLPMITVAEELHQALTIIRQCAGELASSGVAFHQTMPIGMMIETPSAALMANDLLPLVDFVSVGTNDLAQYTLATDRTNEMVADIYDAMHPSVLWLLRHVVHAAQHTKRPLSICGELAGHSAATSVLVGMGITELSVSPPLLYEVKQRIRQLP
jgi:phosphoenolpyruvate-protein phosphotransferase (PTS system enzyme I)